MIPRRAITSETSAFPRVAPARPRTVSRANPPFVRNLPPHARANARFYGENHRQYGGGASSGSVVADDPMDKTDYTGEAFGLDDLVGAGAGAVVGFAVELGKDAITGQEVTAGGLAGAAVGGAIMAEGVVNAPETLGGSLVLAGAVKGAAAGAVSNIVQQGVDNVSGAQKGFSPTSLAVSTAVGAATGGLATKIPTTRVSGVTAGRGNFHAAAAGVRTRIANGNATRMSTGTAVRGAIGSQTGDAGRTGAGGVVSAVQGFVCKHTGWGC